MIHWLRQIFAILSFSLRTLPQRKGSIASALFGIIGVVAVLVGVLSIGQGFRRTMEVAASPDVVLVMRSGADTEMMSGLQREETRVIASTEGIVQDEAGPLASSELFVVINLPKRSTGTDANVPLRGVEQAAYKVRDNFEMLEGRPFEPGRDEIIVGRGAALEFAGLDLGNEVQVGQNRWKVVGIFADDGSISESEIWTDASLLQSAYRRGDYYQSVYLKLRDPAEFTAFKDRLLNDPRLQVRVLRQGEYYSEQSVLLYNMITGLGTLIALMMAVGAVFGALNTMYTAVASRSREIATLRALGFTNSPVLISVLTESVILALVGGAVGGLLAFAAFDGFRAATMNWSSFSQVTFAFEVTPDLLVKGVFYATAIGLVGGLFPAVRAVRQPVADALREA